MAAVAEPGCGPFILRESFSLLRCFSLRPIYYVMREKGKYLCSALAAAVFCSSASMIGAASSGDVYGKISARNLFGLHDPPQAQPPEQPKPQLPKIVLTGTTTILGRKMAFVKIQPPPKAGEQQQGEQSLILGEGQREGAVEVLGIDEIAGSIRVNNSGTEMTVGFDKDAGKVAGGPPLPPNPAGAPNVAGGGRGMNPGVSGFQRMIPTRTGRQVPAIAQPPLPPQAQASIPGQGQAAGTEKPMTPEEQAILRELEQAAQGAPAQSQAPR